MCVKVTWCSSLEMQIRGHMASLGITKFQDLIGRTDLLRVSDTGNPKSKTLNFSLILKNALHMRPGVNIVGGSQRQVCRLWFSKFNAHFLYWYSDMIWLA
jgi:glutamate synthase (NADPH/NADH)